MPEVGKLYSYIDQYGERVFCTVVSVAEHMPAAAPWARRLRVEILSEGKLVSIAWSAEVEWGVCWKEVN